MNEQSLQYFARARELIDTQTPFVSVTLVGSRGHAPQDLAAKMLVSAEGLLAGTVGGGKIEARAIQFAQNMLKERSAPQMATWNLQTEIGMSCGGEVSLFFEPHFAFSWRVAVFGAGHVAQALVPLLAKLDCSVTCIDPRAEWIERLPDSPRLKKVIHENPPEHLSKLEPGTFIVVMTQGHATDFPILKTALGAMEPSYIGVLGSELKAQKIRQELASAGIPAARIEKLRCPMGLDLGNNNPLEIAISIVAQLLQVRGA